MIKRTHNLYNIIKIKLEYNHILTSKLLFLELSTRKNLPKLYHVPLKMPTLFDAAAETNLIFQLRSFLTNTVQRRWFNNSLVSNFRQCLIKTFSKVKFKCFIRGNDYFRQSLLTINFLTMLKKMSSNCKYALEIFWFQLELLSENLYWAECNKE